MKITKNVRKLAEEKGISKGAALEVGVKDEAKEFKHSGVEIYAKANFLPACYSISETVRERGFSYLYF